jgi:PAS domain S-box-containing protein
MGQKSPSQERMQELWNNLAGVKAPPSMLKNQLLAVTFVFLALLLGLALQPLVASFPALLPLPFLLAIACAALYGDLGSAITATILSTIGFSYFLSVRHHGPSVSGEVVLRTGLFVLFAGFVCLLVLKFKEVKRRGLRSQSLYSDFIRSAPVGFSLHKPDTSFLDINPCFADWNGAPREAQIGKTIAEVIPNIAAAMGPNLRRVAETGENLSFEVKGDPLDPQGERHWIASHFPVKNNSGKIEAVGIALFDITKEKLAQAALKESELKYRFLAESISQYVWTTDEAGNIDYCNRHFLEFTGLTLEQVRAGRAIEFIHPDDVEELSRKVRQSHSTGQPFQHEYRARRVSDGEYRWHLAHSELFTDAAGKKRWLGVGIDITDRKAAELEVLKAHEQMRMLVTSISESFIALDREWRFQYANQRVLEQTGKPWTELKGRSMWEIFPEAAKSAFRPGYEKVMQERIPHTFNVSYPQPDGSVRYYEVHAYPTSEGLAALISDITQAKEAQDALSENKQLLRLVLDSADVGTWMWNFETNEVLDLGNTAKLFGKENIGSFEDFYALIHPEDRPVVLSAITSAKRTGQYQCEFRAIKSGITRWLRGTGTVFRNDEGNPLYLAGVTIDVTEKNRSEEERFRLAAIVDSSDDAIISKDLNGVVTSWNNAAEHLFGYRSDEMIGESIIKIIPDELRDEEPRILASLRAGQKIDHYETERLRKNGTRVDVALTISPVKDLSGKIIGASKIARDISERKRVQEALVQSEKLAATGRMAAAIAHEVNNPLEAVTNLAYLVSTDPTLSAVGRSYTKMLLEEIARASEITKQTLAFYRDSGKPSEFDIRELLDNVIRLDRPMFEKKQIKVVTEYRKSERLVGYASEIRQVIANLLLNAIDAVPQGGTIVVRVDVENSISNRTRRVRVTVADNGHGIRPETKKRLFEPFVTTKGARGNGLGLWVSKGILKKHGGSIVTRSSTVPGRSGTVFSVVLPLAQTAPARNIA